MNSSGEGKLLSSMMRLMEQSDLDLLQAVPLYHLQAVLKTRRLATSIQAFSGNASVSNPAAFVSATAAQELAQHLFAPPAIAEVLGQLVETDIMILRELVACGGRANSRDLAFYFASAGLLENVGEPESVEERDRPLASNAPLLPLQPPQYPAAHPHGVFEQALRRLLLSGLLFWGRQAIQVSRDYTSGIHDGVLIVPVAICTIVCQDWPLNDKPVLATKEVDIGERARKLQRALYLYWSLIASQREGLALINSGQLARQALRQVVEQIEQQEHIEFARLESSFPRLFFLRLLLMRLGLVQERRNALHALPDAAEAYFSLPLSERIRRCYRLYVETSFWNELAYLPELNVRPGPSPLAPAHEEIVRARQEVMLRLAYEQPGQVHRLTTVIARMKLYVPYLLFPRQYGARADRYSSDSNPYGWDFRLRRGWLTHREGWHMVEGGFLRAMLAGPLYWLGVVELDREENPQAFRFTSDAALILGEIPLDGPPEPEGRLIVQPNFELIALAPVSEALLIQLDRFAERVSVEHIAQYRLTRASATRAIQRGWGEKDILRVLEQASRRETGENGDIPQNVRYSLSEWERQARRVELWTDMVLLEVDDALLLDEIFDDSEARLFFGKRLAPKLAEVRPQHLSAVQELLWQRQYLPAHSIAPASEGTPAQREPQWRLHENGLLEPCYAVLDLYLIAEVTRFCEVDEATGWLCLTEAAIKQALAQGTELVAIIRFLQQFCENGIPAPLLIRLKLWGGGYEDLRSIQVEQTPLLRLPASILQDLQADAMVSSLLGKEVEQSSRLVHVEPEHLSQLVEMLRERGFTVE